MLYPLIPALCLPLRLVFQNLGTVLSGNKTVLSGNKVKVVVVVVACVSASNHGGHRLSFPGSYCSGGSIQSAAFIYSQQVAWGLP
jgi:hypothetical protein